jgi:hypothetical protein
VENVHCGGKTKAGPIFLKIIKKGWNRDNPVVAKDGKKIIYGNL